MQRSQSGHLQPHVLNSTDDTVNDTDDTTDDNLT